MTSFMITYESMEEQPAKRAKLDGFTTNSSIFSTQAAVGSSILNDAEYPEMYSHYDNPVVNTSIMPLVQNIMLTFADRGNVGATNMNAYDTTAEAIHKFERGHFIRANQIGTTSHFEVSHTDATNDKLIIFADRPVMIKPGMYQIARAVSGVVTVHEDFFKDGFAKTTGAYGLSSAVSATATSGAAAAVDTKPASYIYHYNENECGVEKFHKVFLDLQDAF